MNEPWIELLHASCRMASQASVARKVGYSGAVISQVLSGTYTGDLARVQAAVEGALMNTTVECPVLGTISRAKCIAIQRQPFTPTNPTNVALYRACRSGCPHSFLKPTFASGAQPAVALRSNTGSKGAVSTPARGVASPQLVSPRRVTSPTRRRKRPSSITPEEA